MAKKVVVKPKPTPTPAKNEAVTPGARATAAPPSAPVRPNVLARNTLLPSSPSPVARPGTRAPKLELMEAPGEEHRKFPRARLAVRFQCWIGDEPDLRFSASLKSENLSVSGAFIESSFFLPIGTELRVSFQLDDVEEPVEARAQIIREERPDRNGDGRSGFAIRFVEFYGQTEVTLARLFLGEQLRAFGQAYLSSKRARSLSNELDRVVDALAAWELLKVTTPGDPWRPKGDEAD